MEQLLSNGTSRSWLLGNALVTVSVSKRSPTNVICPYCSSSFPETTRSQQEGSGAQDCTRDESKTTETKEPNENSLHESVGLTRRSEGVGAKVHFNREDYAVIEVPGTGENVTGDQATVTQVTTVPPRDKPLSDGRDAADGIQSKDEIERLATENQCSCVCQGWAEFLVRRPTGNTSWILRLQNRPKLGGNFSSTQSLANQISPQIYDSVIPKAFFGK